MKYRLFFFLLILTLIGLPSQAQNSPDITSFTTSFTNIGRQALENRTARIPVSWTSVNRPITANLVFEQIFADGSSINVELPRVIPWVNSNGDGVAAPILPPGATTILLRVSLKSLFNNRVLDYAEITLPIVEGNGGAGNGLVPTISRFTASSGAVDRAQLEAGSARIPVAWTVVNRPIAAQLYFEQVFSNGTSANVELPRETTWVNSSDSGMVAPRADGSATTITLRLRFVDLIYNRVLDQRLISIPVADNSTSSRIRSFTSSVTSVSANNLQAGNVLIDVAWNVENRPSNSNLVFEQILPNGSSRNAELPRDVQIVPSSGNGIVSAIMPDGNPSMLIFQLRLVDLGTNQTLEVARLEIPIIYATTSSTTTVTGDACYRTPFAPSQGIQVGGQGRVQNFTNGLTLTIWATSDSTGLVGDMSAGTVFTITGTPICQLYNNNDGSTLGRRFWPINANGDVGWVTEYIENGANSFVYFFVPATSSDIPTVDALSFSISPNIVDVSALDTTYVTFRWQTVNATRVYISGLPSGYDNLPTSGELSILARDLHPQTNPQTYTFGANDSQDNYETIDVSFSFNSNVSVRSFTVSNSNPRAGSQITFNWDIAGTFQQASIWYSASLLRPELNGITTITSNSGSYTFTLPTNIAGQRTITLTYTDVTGANQSTTLTINIACAYDWGMGISDSDCPSNSEISQSAAYQNFQRGFMIWLPVDEFSSNYSMWAFYNDGTFGRYYDNWDGSAYTITPAPPDGLLAPQRGFGYLWNTTPAVRSGLAWATASEQSYNAQYQRTLSQQGYSDIRYYISLPDGRIIKVTHSMTSGDTWQ